MGTEGMKASLISREVIADSVELVVRGHLLDGFVGISGCDKTIPAMVMAMARLNLPSVMLYGGSIAYGEYKGKRLTIQDVFEAIGAFNAGKIDAHELNEIEGRACPGAGACGGQFTANTMSTAFEMLGVSPMGFNDVPAIDPRKEEVAFETGRLVMDLLRKGAPAAPDHHPQVAPQRDRRRDGDGRLDQRRPAPARHRQGGGREARRSTSSIASRARRRCSPTCGRGAPTQRPRCTTPAAWAWSPSGCSTPGS